MKQIKCPSCGADNPIPPTGLEIVCEYCGFSRPVPDVDKRRAQQAKEAEAQRRAEERAQRRAEQRAQRQAERKQRAKEARFRWMGSIWTKLTGALLPLAISGFVFYQVGFLDPLLAGSGMEALNQQLQLLTGQGYTLQQEPQSHWALGSKDAIRLAPPKGSCYALVVAAGPAIDSLTLNDGHLRRPDDQTAIVSFCLKAPAALTAALRLKKRGRYSWALLAKPYSAAEEKTQAQTAAEATTPSTVRFPKGCLLRRRPKASSPTIGRLTPRTTYRVLERRGRWYKLLLGRHKRGWAGCEAEAVR